MILETVLLEEFWTQATLPANLSGLSVRQCQNQYQASYSGSVHSSDDFVPRTAGENPKNFKDYQDPYSLWHNWIFQRSRKRRPNKLLIIKIFKTSKRS